MTKVKNFCKSSYPKLRPLLPPEYQKIYLAHYFDNRDGLTFSGKITQWMEAWGHKKAVVKPVEGPVLEIGAGTLNHLTYEPEVKDYDIVEPFTELYFQKPERMKLRYTYSDISEIPPDQKYKRIISLWTFEHIEDLPKVVAEAASRLSDEGEMRIGIPTEGGLLWYCAWRFGAGLLFRLKHGFSYKPVMKSEHLNHADEIVAILKYFFAKVEVCRYPVNCKHLSFYSFIYARNPLKLKAKQYLLNT